MSDVSIRAALETRLAALAQNIATAYENVPFTPTDGTPYQLVHMMPAEPENPELGSSLFKRFIGIFQVMLMYPQSVGPGVAAAQAEAVRAWFPRGLSLVQGGITVTIDSTPYVMAGFEDGDRWAVPIRIPYFANVGS